MNRLIVFVLAASVVCCTAHSPHPEETAVLLPLAPSASDVHHAQAAFDTWVRSGRIPGAGFRIIQVGPTRTEAFMARARELFDIALRGNDAGALGSPALAAPPTVNVVTLPEHDSRGTRWTWDASRRASHTAVLCDVSPSTSGTACSAQYLVRALDTWLAETSGGGSFQVWVVGRSIDARRVFDVESPDEGIAQRAAYLLSARNELRRVLDQPQPDAGSDIAGAIAVAVSDLAAKPGAKRLVLLTDLRQSAGPWSFEDAVPAPRTFVRWLEGEHLLPDCHGIRVTACGVHFSTTPGGGCPFDARRDHDIRSVWTASFQAMRAASVEICDACPDAFRPTNGGE